MIPITRPFIRRRRPAATAVCLLVLAVVAAAPLSAQDVTLEPLQVMTQVSALLEVDGQVLAGTRDGGLLLWPAADPTDVRRLLAGDELSGNAVSDLVWTGRYVWIATVGGGLTRLTDPAGAPEFRQYTSNLGDLQITAVTGMVIGGSERVFYGMKGKGIGQITDGLSGYTYDAAQDGLIDDNVNALQIYAGELFVATGQGISKFADNVFEDVNTGLTNLTVHDLALDRDGSLLAAGNGGVYRWDPTGESWSAVGAVNNPIHELAVDGDRLWCRGVDGSGNAFVAWWSGADWPRLVPPFRLCTALFAGEDLWVGGRDIRTGMAGDIGYPWYGRLRPDESFETWTLEESQVANVEGITFDAAGRPWLGGFNADAISWRDEDGVWSSIYEVASVGNDSTGLFNQGANILSAATDRDGRVWACQYYSGLLRIDPETGSTDHVTPLNSGLDGRNVVNMVAHPDGPLLLMHDWADPGLVDVLVDPAAWEGTANWLSLPQGPGGLGSSPSVWDALVERRDVIWFAVQGVGLVRWDVNGEAAGPDDPLTWLDTSDDVWDLPISDIIGSAIDPRAALGLARTPDGTIWAGGNGLVGFQLNATRTQALALAGGSLTTMTNPLVPGLVDGNVKDIAVDRHGDLWVATRAGLNRVRVEGGKASVVAWLDLANYLSDPSYGLLYSPSVISQLPGLTYHKIVPDADGSRLLLSADQGAVLINVGDLPVKQGGSLSGLVLYPNPLEPATGTGRLNLGGLDADSDAPAQVEIYNLEGQLVYRDRNVAADSGFWDGRNRVGEEVTTGMYLVKVTWQGATAVRTLAVVR